MVGSLDTLVLVIGIKLAAVIIFLWASDYNFGILGLK